VCVAFNDESIIKNIATKKVVVILLNFNGFLKMVRRMWIKAVRRRISLGVIVRKSFLSCGYILIFKLCNSTACAECSCPMLKIDSGISEKNIARVKDLVVI